MMAQGADVDFLALGDGDAHVFFADKIDGRRRRWRGQV